MVGEVLVTCWRAVWLATLTCLPAFQHGFVQVNNTDFTLGHDSNSNLIQLLHPLVVGLTGSPGTEPLPPGIVVRK